MHNFTPTGTSGDHPGSAVRSALLPPSSFLSVELPLVYMREQEHGVKHCLTSLEARYCMSDHTSHTRALHLLGRLLALAIVSHVVVLVFLLLLLLAC